MIFLFNQQTTLIILITDYSKEMVDMQKKSFSFSPLSAHLQLDHSR